MIERLRISRILIVLLIGLGIGVGVVSFHYLSTMFSISSTGYPILKPGEGFAMRDVMGQMHHSDEWLGHVIMLNFWATWCPPCRKEIPGFVDLYHTYHDQGLVVVGIAIDELEDVRRFLIDLSVDYPNLIGEDVATKLAIHYGNRAGGLPYTVFIDRKGKVVSTHLGGLSHADAERIVRPLL